MRIIYTPEMKALRKIFEPYIDNTKLGVKLYPYTPKDAVEAYNKYFELFDRLSAEAEAELYAAFDE